MLPESTAPGIRVVALPWPALQPRPPRHNTGCGGADQTISPSAIRIAFSPPGVGDCMSPTPMYTIVPSLDAPHWPPKPLPRPNLVCQTIAPSLSGSSANARPDFCGGTSRSLPFTVTSVGGAEKSKSGPSVSGQAGFDPSFFCGHPPVQLSPVVAWRTHLMTPVLMSSASTASVVFCTGSA